ncbi:MAG: DUF6273 domain-containing protein [Clostridiales bacterium]|nr:DUF6273 domain-containing protein [Clostridiales bacterium]
MRNDEAIDIQLEEVSDEDLTPEEIANQNYNTALRYINIAEHMNQFEDKDKYYQRAIKYLHLARPYIKVWPLLKELRQKKYLARAEGKISLYKEACEVRDRAKTPTDYYSAQNIFERIHKHEVTHKIPQRRVSKELYEQLSHCEDSEQQAIYCREKAEETAAKMKRHSLIISICFIAAIVALLAFTRTAAFRQCLGIFYSVTGDHAGAWKAYQRVYTMNGSEAALEQYEEHRYLASIEAADEDKFTTAYNGFRALAELEYKDSEERLLALEQKKLSEKDLSTKVTFADMDWRILDKEDDRVLLIKDSFITDVLFLDSTDSSEEACTWETSSVRTWLNTTFLEENFLEAEINAICETTVVAEANPVYGTSAGNDTVDQVFLLSAKEAETYYDVLHGTETCWWLRTPGITEDSMCYVYKDKTVMTFGYDYTSDKFSIKPAIWVSLEDVNAE